MVSCVTSWWSTVSQAERNPKDRPEEREDALGNGSASLMEMRAVSVDWSALKPDWKELRRVFCERKPWLNGFRE